MDALISGIVTRRDGPLNIAAHSPINSNVPDLGPKGYWSQISNDAPGGQGSTKLHSAFLNRLRRSRRSLADLSPPFAPSRSSLVFSGESAPSETWAFLASLRAPRVDTSLPSSSHAQDLADGTLGFPFSLSHDLSADSSTSS
jgi:hypothetical protein